MIYDSDMLNILKIIKSKQVLIMDFSAVEQQNM